MRKEIILAIVLGVILGLIIIFGINLANQSASNSPTPTPSPTQITQPPAETTSLQITSPENNSVSDQNTLTLTGKTKENSWISLIWEEGQVIVKSDQDGSFSQEIELIGGENVIKITATDGADYQESQEIVVIYTTANLSDSSTQEVASPSAEQIKQSLIQRIQGNSKEDVLKGYSGVITKINDLSLTISTSQNETLQVTTNEATDIVRNGKPIKVSSLSIDEKLIIIGVLDTDEILSSKRIVAIETTTPDYLRQTIVGTIKNFQVTNLEISSNNQEFSLDIPKKSDIDTEDFQENQVVMAIIETDLEDDTHTLLAVQPLLQ